VRTKIETTELRKNAINSAEPGKAVFGQSQTTE
jgi:hypothetical protein